MASGSEHNDQIVTTERSLRKLVPIEMSLSLPAMQVQCGSTAKRNHKICKDAGFHKEEKSEVGQLLKSHAKSAKTTNSTESKQLKIVKFLKQLKQRKRRRESSGGKVA